MADNIGGTSQHGSEGGGRGQYAIYRGSATRAARTRAWRAPSTYARSGRQASVGRAIRWACCLLIGSVTLLGAPVVCAQIAAGGGLPFSVEPDGTKLVRIYVLSPESGMVRQAGEDHYESIKTALRVFGRDLIVDDQRYQIDLSRQDTGPDSLRCVDAAERAVDEGALAILGPVTSTCTRRLLALDLEIPILSSLATATSVVRENNGWFFRTITDDKRRFSNFFDAVAQDEIDLYGAEYILYQSSDVYSEGLLADIRSLREFTDDQVFSWDASVANRIEEGGALRYELDRAFAEGIGGGANTFYILGNSKGAVAIAQALSRETNSNLHQYVIFGSTELIQHAPPNTYVIAEPRVRDSEDVKSELSGSPDALIPSIDAVLVLKESIEQVLEQPAEGGDIQRMRAQLRDVLAERTSLPSCEYGRRVRFDDNGDISDVPTTPVYRVARTLEPVVGGKATPRVAVEVGNPRLPYLGGPVVLNISADTSLLPRAFEINVSSGDGTIVYAKPIEMVRTHQQISLLPTYWGIPAVSDGSFEGRYSVSISGAPYGSNSIDLITEWPLVYLWAILGALAGAFVRAKPREEEKAAMEAVPMRRRIRAYVEGTLVGLFIAFVILHLAPALEGDPIFSLIPIPQFGPHPSINAFVAGTLGGWLGLNLVVGLLTAGLGKIPWLRKQEAE